MQKVTSDMLHIQLHFFRCTPVTAAGALRQNPVKKHLLIGFLKEHQINISIYKVIISCCLCSLTWICCRLPSPSVASSSFCTPQRRS